MDRTSAATTVISQTKSLGAPVIMGMATVMFFRHGWQVAMLTVCANLIWMAIAVILAAQYLRNRHTLRLISSAG